MSLNGLTAGLTAASFPRVSGDEPFQHILNVGASAFSPRERG